MAQEQKDDGLPADLKKQSLCEWQEAYLNEQWRSMLGWYYVMKSNGFDDNIQVVRDTCAKNPYDTDDYILNLFVQEAGIKLPDIASDDSDSEDDSDDEQD